MKAKRKAKHLLSSGLLPAWDLASGFRVGAKGKIAAFDQTGSQALGADSNRGCGSPVSGTIIINTFNDDNNNYNCNYLAPAHIAYDMNDSFQVCGRGGKIRSSIAWSWGYPRPWLLLRNLHRPQHPAASSLHPAAPQSHLQPSAPLAAGFQVTRGQRGRREAWQER